MDFVLRCLLPSYNLLGSDNGLYLSDVGRGVVWLTPLNDVHSLTRVRCRLRGVTDGTWLGGNMSYDANWSSLRTRMQSGTIRDPYLRINLCSGLEPLASGGGGAVIIRMAALPSGWWWWWIPVIRKDQESGT